MNSACLHPAGVMASNMPPNKTWEQCRRFSGLAINCKEGQDSGGSCKTAEKKWSMSSNYKATGEKGADLCFPAFKEFDLSSGSEICLRGPWMP